MAMDPACILAWPSAECRLVPPSRSYFSSTARRLRAWLALPHVKIPLAIAGSTRLAVFLAAFFGLRLLGSPAPTPFLLHGGRPHPVRAIDMFQRFDAYWFLNIARNGYVYAGPQDQLNRKAGRAKETNVTPFPLYPLLVWFASIGLGDLSLSALFVSWLFYFVAMLVLFRLVARAFDEDTGARAVLYASIYPIGFIYSAMYSESLFLLLTLLAIQAAEEGRVVRAGLCGMGASLTRLAGGLLAVPLAAQIFYGDPSRPASNRAHRALLAAGLVTLGWVVYFSYLQGLTGDFYAYFAAQLGWHKSFAPPWASLAKLLGPGLFRDGVRCLDLATFLLFILLAVRGRRTLRIGQLLYLFVGILMPLSSTNLLGLTRYLMVLFPAYTVLALEGRSKILHGTVVLLFSFLHVVMLLAWLQWKHSF
jgi:hypothetical protein